MYQDTFVPKQKMREAIGTVDTVGKQQVQGILVERVQTGVRLEKRLLKVLKGLAEYHDMTLGDLIEGIVLHAFDGKHPFSDETRRRIADLKRIYRLDLDSSASHRLLEKAPGRPTAATRRAGKRGTK